MKPISAPFNNSSNSFERNGNNSLSVSTGTNGLVLGSSNVTIPNKLASGSTTSNLFRQNTSQNNQTLNQSTGLSYSSNSTNNLTTVSSKTNINGSSSKSNLLNLNDSDTYTTSNSAQTGANIMNTNSK